MADFQEATEAPLSTVIDTDAAPGASGAGQPRISEPAEVKAEQPAALRDDIAAVMKEAEADKGAEEKAKDEKAVEKPTEAKSEDKPDAKVEAAPEKGAKADDAAEGGKGEAEPAAKPETDKERHGRVEAPRNFLPDAREQWKNVPHAVRREIETMTKDYEARIAQHQQATKRYEDIRPYDELARSNGRDLRDSLDKVIEIETALQENPIAGLNHILMEVGPRKADGQPFSLFEVADFIVRQGQQGYQQMVQQRHPANDQGNAQVQQLQQQIAALQAKIDAAPMEQVVERFALNNARFHELQNDVAFFLRSDKISASLSPEERLAAAYDMAVRINPASTVERVRDSEEGTALADGRAGSNFSGSKSIRSSPGAVNEEVEDQATAKESVRDSILKAGRRLRA